ncbi:MAG: CoA-binding protein [Marinobacter sp.]|nr:CoA-binding protein [Marinobacter sp.]
MPTNDAEALKSILTRVKTIALVGASDKPDRPSHDVMHFLQQQGYRVIPVNPRLAGQIVLGETVYADLDQLPQPVDMVELFLASERVPPVVDHAIQHRIPFIWMQVGVINEAAAAKAEAAGLTVIMDRCPKREIPRLGLLL